MVRQKDGPSSTIRVWVLQLRRKVRSTSVNSSSKKKDFTWESEMDGDAIEMAFSKKKIEARKTWLRHCEAGTFLDMRAEKINYCDFVNKERILFSMADLSRSKPSMVDGFKPGQRKILFCCLKRNFVQEAKIAQFSGHVSEHSAYHHGEDSLASTIIGMAQNFLGSNNMNLLSPEGQFGTREEGGKNHASPGCLPSRVYHRLHVLFFLKGTMSFLST
ncbi:hypothetical protein M758_5G130200 [Ceratodon purpureus]|nr:hypothetical protein M758_5G130200 [Ceratodon purpureus]